MDGLDEFLNDIGVNLNSTPNEETHNERINTLLGEVALIHPQEQSEPVVEEATNEAESTVPQEEPQETQEETTGGEVQASWTPEQPNSLSDDTVNDILGNFGMSNNVDYELSITPSEGGNSDVIYAGDGLLAQLRATPVHDMSFDYSSVAEAIQEIADSVEPVRAEPNFVNEEDDNFYDVDSESESSSIDEGSEGIPENSPTLTMDESTSRFSGTEWFDAIQTKRVVIAGCGGIGSWTTLQIARMSPAALFLYDDDTVETANMSGQLFSRDDIGRHKVDAMASMIGKYTSTTHVYAVPERFDSSTIPGTIMICGFDNMAARKTFFESWKNLVGSTADEEKKNCLFIDGRLSIDCLQVLCMTGDDEANMRRYEEQFLFNDSEADETICSMKQTTYLACMIGSIIVNLFTNFVAGSLDPVIPYDLPFFTEYDAQNMIFKTEN